MIRQLFIRGQDVGQYVLDWGSVDDTKDLLLAKTQLFSGQYQAKLAYGNTLFAPLGAGSLFYGIATLNMPIQLVIDGVTIYNGFIRSVSVDGGSREATVTAENYFSKLSQAQAILTQTTVNPASAMLSLIDAAGLSALVDTNSFYAAGGAAGAAGATIDIDYKATGSTTVLAAIQDISQLVSIQVYVAEGLIRAKQWQAYAGNGSGCRGTLSSSSGWVKSWGSFDQAPDNLNNSVTVQYGASSSLTLTDNISVLSVGQTINFPFSTATGSSLAVPDQISAQYFGALFLSRASTLRSTIIADCGPQLISANLGDRWLVTAPNCGLVSVAMEIIETHRKPMENGIGLKLATI